MRRRILLLGSGRRLCGSRHDVVHTCLGKSTAGHVASRWAEHLQRATDPAIVESSVRVASRRADLEAARWRAAKRYLDFLKYTDPKRGTGEAKDLAEHGKTVDESPGEDAYHDRERRRRRTISPTYATECRSHHRSASSASTSNSASGSSSTKGRRTMSTNTTRRTPRKTPGKFMRKPP